MPRRHLRSRLAALLGSPDSQLNLALEFRQFLVAGIELRPRNLCRIAGIPDIHAFLELLDEIVPVFERYHLCSIAGEIKESARAL